MVKGIVRRIGEVKLDYDGLFLFKPFMYTITNWLKERGYNVHESGYSEVVKADHKELSISFEATKEPTENTKYYIIIEIELNQFKDVLVKKEDSEDTYQSSVIALAMTGKLESDKEAKWGGKPVYQLFRMLYEKYIIGDVFAEYEKEIKKDMEDLRFHLKQHLNLYQSGFE